MFSHSTDHKNEKMVFTSNDYYINDRDKKFDVINSHNTHTTNITQNSNEGNPLRQMDYNKTHEGNFNINSNTNSNFYKSYKHPGNSSLTLQENSETLKTYDTMKKYSYQDSYEYPTNIHEDNLSKYTHTKYANDPFRNNSEISSNVNKSNQSFNYNSELKHYRDVVEKMHEEINSLNTKLNELDKNNSLSLSNVEAPYKKVINYPTRDFIKDIPETSYGYYGVNERSSYDNCNRNASDNYLDNLRLNYNYTTESLTNDTELNSPTYYSSGSVKHNMEGVIPIDSKASIPINKKHKDNKGDKQTNFTSSTTPSRSKSKTNPNTNTTVSRVNKFSTNTNINKPRTNTKESKSSVSKKENNSKTLKQTQKAKSVSNIKKSKALNSKNTKAEVNISSVLKDNENLKNQIKFLEKKLNDINEQTRLDQIERKGKDYLRIELEIWKSKTDLLSKNYIQTLSSMKKQILDDKNMFVEKIKSMEDEYANEIVSLKNKYQNLLERQELSLKLYKKENENLKKKLSKVKEILI